MFNFVLCDDNIDTLNKLSYMFETIFIKNNLKAQIAFKSTKDSEILKYVNQNRFDAIVLDISLHGKLTWLQIAEKIRIQNKDCFIIFTTGHSEYVFMAYKYKTFDYLCKPILQDRLEETVLRLQDDIRHRDSRKKYIKIDDKNTFIDATEIQFIKRDGMKIIFHTTSGDIDTYSSFNKLQNRLPNNFVRCHKSFIANINNIIKFEPQHNKILFTNNQKCDVGPKYKNNFVEAIEYYGNIK